MNVVNLISKEWEEHQSQHESPFQENISTGKWRKGHTSCTWLTFQFFLSRNGELWRVMSRHSCTPQRMMDLASVCSNTRDSATVNQEKWRRLCPRSVQTCQWVWFAEDAFSWIISIYLYVHATCTFDQSRSCWNDILQICSYRLHYMNLSETGSQKLLVSRNLGIRDVHIWFLHHTNFPLLIELVWYQCSQLGLGLGPRLRSIPHLFLFHGFQYEDQITPHCWQFVMKLHVPPENPFPRLD